MTDELTDTLFAEVDRCSDTTFTAAESEVLDFLLAEVYPEFEKTHFGTTEPKPGGNLLSVVKSTLSRRRKSLLRGSDRSSLTQIMEKILSDPTYLSIFRNYMVDNKADNLLYGYNEIVEIQERLSYLTDSSSHDSRPHAQAQARVSPHAVRGPPPQAGGTASAAATHDSTMSEQQHEVGDSATVVPENDVELQIFFYYVNGFYDAYLSLGAPFKLDLPNKEITKSFHAQLVECREVDIKIFDGLKSTTLDSMIRYHLQAFLDTSDYHRVVRSGRLSILNISKSMTIPLAESLLRRESVRKSMDEVVEKGLHGQAQPLVAEAVDNDKANSEASVEHALTASSGISSGHALTEDDATSNSTVHPMTSSRQRVRCEAKNVMTRVELKNMLHSAYCGCLESYLHLTKENVSALAMLQFYHASWSFQHGNFRNKFEQASECSSIFDRFISRNSEDQIGVSDKLRHSIAHDLHLASPFIFKGAMEWVFERLHDGYWHHFKLEVMCKAKAASRVRKARDEAKHGDFSSDSDSSSCSQTKSNVHDGGYDDSDDDQSSLEEAENSNGGPATDDFMRLAHKFFPPAERDSANPERWNRANLVISSKTKQSETLPSKQNTATSAPAAPGTATPVATTATIVTGDNHETGSAEASRKPSLRENCQEHRRRSMNKGAEPTRALAMSLANRSYRRNSVGAPTVINNTELTNLLKAHAQKMNEAVPDALAPRDGDSDPTTHPTGTDTTTALTRQNSRGLLSSPSSSPERTSEKRKMLQGNRRGEVLRSILAHPNSCSIFKEFLERESCSQTILFIVDVEAYRHITIPAYQKMRARKIYNKYLHRMSIMTVPISTETQQQIGADLEMAGPSLFSKAQDDVMDYIESCQFTKLLKAPEMTLVYNILEAEERNRQSEPSSPRFVSRPHKGAFPSRRRLSSLYFQEVDIGDTRSLRHILRNQLCTRFFKDFCNRIFVNESLFFWLDAEHYQGLPSVEYMRRTASKICRKYIYENSNLEINIPHHVREDILNNLARPTRILFKKAQSEIFKLLEQDALPHFVRGPEYSAMLTALQASKKGTKSSQLSTFQRVIARFL